MVQWLGMLGDGFLISGGWWLAGHGLRQTRTVDRLLATAVVAFAWCVLGLQALGSFGLLAIGPLLLWSAGLSALGLGARALWPGTSRISPQGDDRPEPWSWEVLLALGLVVWASAVMGMSSLLLPVKVVSDGPIYHLYFAARWWKAQRLFLVAAPFGENAATYFPANGDLWFTWLMVTWGGDRLARAGQLPFLLLSALAVCAISRTLGTRRNSAVLGACWFVTSTPLFIFSFEANVDSIFVACYLIAVAFVLSYVAENGGTPAIVLVGLAAGLALGTKPVGVVFIPPLLLVALGAIAARAGALRKGMVQSLALLAGVVVPSGFWYGRNLILTGNLLYPLNVTLFGTTILQGWYDREAMQFSPYYMPITEWRALFDTLLAMLDPRLFLLWLAALAGGWAWRRGRRAPTDRWVWFMSFLACSTSRSTGYASPTGRSSVSCFRPSGWPQSRWGGSSTAASG